MPPRENATACHANFVEEIDEWNEEIAFVKNRNKIDQDKLNELKEIKNSVIEAAKKLKRLDPNYAESYPDVEPAKTKVRNDLEDMKELLVTCQQKPPETPIDKDEQIKALILQLSAELQFYDDEATSTLNKADLLIKGSPEPDKNAGEDVNMFVNKQKDTALSAKNAYVQIVKESALLSKEEDNNAIKTKSFKMLENIENKVRRTADEGRVYLAKIPQVPQNQTTGFVKSAPLERLPLPTFKGVKTEYLRFKMDFKKHVKYESVEEHMLALKTRCLIKNADKLRVSNETTSDDCWIKLDQEYGDIDTLVADIFTQWSNLKPPNNDSQFIKFMETLDYGVSCLKSLGREKELDSSYSAVTLETKLPTRMKQEYS